MTIRNAKNGFGANAKSTKATFVRRVQLSNLKHSKI